MTTKEKSTMERQFTLDLTREEYKKIDELAIVAAVTTSEVVTFLVHLELMNPDPKVCYICGGKDDT